MSQISPPKNHIVSSTLFIPMNLIIPKENHEILLGKLMHQHIGKKIPHPYPLPSPPSSHKNCWS